MDPVLVTVTRIIDGDTVFVNAPGLAERVRFIGVNAPEIAHPPDPEECYGDEATEFTRALQSRQVWLTFDVGCRDDYDRLLAYVWVGNGPQDLWSRQLVRRGFARKFPFAPNTAFADVLDMDQTAAVRDNLGMWGACR
jgi:micrococcal nuclease